MKKIVILLSLIMCIGLLPGCKAQSESSSSADKSSKSELKTEKDKQSIEDFTKDYEVKFNNKINGDYSAYAEFDVSDDKKILTVSLIVDSLELTSDERDITVNNIGENIDNSAIKIVSLFNEIYNDYKDNGYDIYEIFYLMDSDRFVLETLQSDKELDKNYIIDAYKEKGNEKSRQNEEKSKENKEVSKEDTRYEDLCSELQSFGDKYNTTPQIEVRNGGILIWMYVDYGVSNYIENEAYENDTGFMDDFLTVWDICKKIYGNNYEVCVAWVNPDGNLILRNESRFYYE